ncbi:PREDICTED: FAS-associated death domain protein isoform X2 [Poecilia mexicana]|uniref:Death domain-containing protein n=2 Tax=Poecilia TaxID=8080 RepID=A0A3B3Z1M8_9TELE|nr:PREDICTED: FAS-associated death domain protein isoform X1 [Poecilia mexicana]XP_014834883.1 PREDICTED: FAS-associated death domain protein isoform X2 [Poecilia mexicana]
MRRQKRLQIGEERPSLNPKQPPGGSERKRPRSGAPGGGGDMSASSFNSVLLGISNMLKEENLEQLKFLVRDHIGKQKLERIKTGHQLFEILTERGQLGKDKANYLCQLLRQVQRDDLSEKLSNWEVQQEDPKYGLSDNERDKLDIATEVIRDNLGRNWRKLGRKLRLGETKLDSIATRQPTDLEETAMELLKEWRKIRGPEVQTKELIAALRDCQLNLTADKIQEKLEQKGLSSSD